MKGKFQTGLAILDRYMRYVLILATVVIIGFLFPREPQFKYEFEEGAIWMYPDLHAPYDFPILKSQEELEAERRELEEKTAIYVYDAEIPKQVEEQFGDDFQHSLEAIRENPQMTDVLQRPDRYKTYGEAFLRKLYQRGIVALMPEHRAKGDDFVISIVRGNTVQRQTVQSVLDLAKAKSYVSDSLPYSRLAQPEFLLPLLQNVLRPNVLYSDSLTQKYVKDQLSGIGAAQGLVRADDLIVSQGERITPLIYQKLVSYREAEMKSGSRWSSYVILLGYLLLTAFIVGLLVAFLRVNAPEVFRDTGKLIFFLMWVVIYSVLVYLVERKSSLSAYVIPFAVAPIVIKTFFSDRLALFTHLIVVMMVSVLSSQGYEFTILQLMAGIVAVMTNPDERDWTAFFRALFFIFAAYLIGHLGITLLQEGRLSMDELSFLGWICVSVFLTLLAYPLVPLLGRMFGYVSPILLVELSDMNRPLLQELALKAPGTLQHSLQVGNMAETAARAIGADALLVKVGALYHDIGKTLHPEYFIENQSGRNPHEDLSDLESAKIIIQHVPDGVALAKKYGLPEQIIDFIRTHHGTTRTEYFYRNYLKAHPDEQVDESLFRYPGPKPGSKEQTILMLADSLEASSKSLKDPTAEDIDKLADQVIAGKLAAGQLDDSAMTFREFKICTEIFKKTLKNIHHIRVEYPK